MSKKTNKHEYRLITPAAKVVLSIVEGQIQTAMSIKQQHPELDRSAIEEAAMLCSIEGECITSDYAYVIAKFAMGEMTYGKFKRFVSRHNTHG